MDRYIFLLRERLARSREWIDKRNPVRFELVLLACLVVGLTVLVGTAYLPSLRGFREGEPSPRKVVAHKTVTVVDLEATEQLKKHVAELVAPVYTFDEGAPARAAADLGAFLEKIRQVRLDFAGGQDLGSALAAARAGAPSTLSDQSLRYLIETDQSSFSKIADQALGALRALYSGVITEGSVEAALPHLRQIAESVASSSETATVVYELASGFVLPNRVIDEAETEARRQAAMKQVMPVMASVAENEVVLQEGETITAEHMLILKALGLVNPRWGWKVWLGVFLVVLLETGIFSRLAHRFNRKEPEFGNNMMLVLVFLLLLFTGLARALILRPFSPYVIPVVALGIVVAIVLNSRTALLMALLASLNVGLLTDLDARYMVVALLVSSLVLYPVSRVTRRTGLIAAAFIAIVLAFVSIFAIELFREAEVAEALRSSLWGLASGVLAGILAVVLLAFLETVFNLTTPLRLLELADPAHPLLKRLMQVAPGTYNHSIQMGNLAEAAAEAIGANSLLARVGAYYHDIGKTVRPEYFVENQIYVDNPHDRLSPSLSKLAITAHVRDGEQLARAYGLPQPIIDIIRQHHGTSVLAYFYHKALQSTKNGEVYEESFRYEEQKPKSKEAAIVMLADSVEAAVRALENPTRRKIQAVIEDVIRQKVDDGQLDESALTLDDLRKVREAFDASLLGLVGHRIRYPDAEERVSKREANGNSSGPKEQGIPEPRV
ncbi:MAG: HDIG domain-containing protein [Thermoleophilia bacterium]|nr:HDIG domain-containing protein [Thermoleophilia bacterium]